MKPYSLEDSREVASSIGAPVTISEVEEAIKSLQSKKSSGPIGYTPEIYKAFSSVLAPYLVKVFNDAVVKGHLPPT